MMQRGIMVPVPARNNSSSCCNKGCGDRIRTGTRNALVIEISPWSEEDVWKPGRQEHPIVDGPSDGRPLPCHNGIGSLFCGHSFCFLSHRFVLQQVFHVRNEPKAVFKRYPEGIHIAQIIHKPARGIRLEQQDSGLCVGPQKRTLKRRGNRIFSDA